MSDKFWAWMIWWSWGRDLTARYFAWKTTRKYTRYVSSTPLTTKDGPDAEFEAWYDTQNLSPWADWHPERGGYTRATSKQLCWQVWQAAKSSELPNVKVTGAPAHGD